MAAKRVQDELQHQKEILDRILDELRSTDKARSQHILHLIHSHAPLPTIEAHVLQSNATPKAPNPPEVRTRVPIDLLIQAEEVLSRQSPSDVQSTDRYSLSPPGTRYTDASPASTFPPMARTSTNAVQENEWEVSHRLVRNLHGRSESESRALLRDLRSSPDPSTFLYYYRQNSPRSIVHSPGRGT